MQHARAHRPWDVGEASTQTQTGQRSHPRAGERRLTTGAACGAIGPTKSTPAEAASAWNTRVIVGAGDTGAARPEDLPVPGPYGAVLPVEMESRLVGDIAGFRVSEVELREERDPTRLCLGRALETIAGDLILVQVSGTIVGGFAWVYAKQRPIPPERAS